MKKEFETLDFVIGLLWMLVILSIFYSFCFGGKDFILIGLSALLASASVMKNIENTNKIEKEKIKKELFDRRSKIITNLDKLLYKTSKYTIFDNNYIDEQMYILLGAEYSFDDESNKLLKTIYNKLSLYSYLLTSYANNNEVSKAHNDLYDILYNSIGLLKESLK